MEKYEMQFPLKAVTIALSIFLSSSVSSQDLDGLKVLVLSASQTNSSANPRNAIWTGLEAEGVDLTFVRDKLSKYKLDRFDQLWIFSSSQFDARFFTKRDFQAFTQFARNGKGLYLLSDAARADLMPITRPPTRRIGYATFEANAIASELFQAKVHGCYKGQQTLRLTDAPHSHPLLKNVDYLYEGTTVSRISNTEQLDVIVSASDGKPLIAVAKSPDLNVVLDCGSTRYYQKSTDDSVRLAINIAHYLNQNAHPSGEPDSSPSP